MVSDYLKVHGWYVWHISSIGKAKEHPYTAVAKVHLDKLSYSVNTLI